jgi:hypothetical protein
MQEQEEEIFEEENNENLPENNNDELSVETTFDICIMCRRECAAVEEWKECIMDCTKGYTCGFDK